MNIESSQHQANQIPPLYQNLGVAVSANGKQRYEAFIETAPSNAANTARRRVERDE